VLRASLGKREIRNRLLDADGRPVTSLAVAKKLYPEAAAQAEAILAKAEGGPVRLTRQQIVGLVGKWYVKELARARLDAEVLSFDAYTRKTHLPCTRSSNATASVAPLSVGDRTALGVSRTSLRASASAIGDGLHVVISRTRESIAFLCQHLSRGIVIGGPSRSA